MYIDSKFLLHPLCDAVLSLQGHTGVRQFAVNEISCFYVLFVLYGTGQEWVRPLPFYETATASDLW